MDVLGWRKFKAKATPAIVWEEDYFNSQNYFEQYGFKVKPFEFVYSGDIYTVTAITCLYKHQRDTKTVLHYKMMYEGELVDVWHPVKIEKLIDQVSVFKVTSVETSPFNVDEWLAENTEPATVIEAGTYTFNNELTIDKEFSQNINIVLSVSEVDASGELHCSRIRTGDNILVADVYKMVIREGGEEIVEELEEPQPVPIYYNGSFVGDIPISQTHTITKDTEVDETFGTWYIANTDYNEVNSGETPETPTKKFTRLYLGEVAYSSNGKRFRKLQTDEPIITTLSATLPVKLDAMGVGTVGENIYLFGGLNDRHYPANTIYKFDTKTNSLTTPSATLPYTLYGIACGVVGTDIYLFGGNTSDVGEEIRKYDTTTDTLTTLSASMRNGLVYIACGVVGTDIYLFGGMNNTSTDTIYKFDTITNRLTTLPITLPKASASMGCAVVGTDIYLFGGSTPMGELLYSQTIYKFDTIIEAITTIPTTLPLCLTGIECKAVGTDIYLFGGISNGYDNYYTSAEYQNTIYKFDTKTNNLTTTEMLPIALNVGGCGGVETNIYLFGGKNDSGCVNTIYKYKAI